VEALGHFVKKESAFEYVDSHAGAGLFNLASKDAKKLEEHNYGISKLVASDFPELLDFFTAIRAYNKSAKINFYLPSLNIFYASRTEPGYTNYIHKIINHCAKTSKAVRKCVYFVKMD
jgi:23S rRNA A2030 N6-methylase RlmJ